jgi:ABC-type multidrug transport system fused ATPase/permease subunit
LNIFNSIKKVKTSLFEEFKIIENEEPKIYMNEDIEEIEIKNLNFKYDENHALKDINLKFEKNKKYLIYGKNGSGKSTLFKLISKIYGNYSGDILVNKRPLKKIEDKSYYEKIGIIFQKPFMFNDTLKENIFLYSNYEQNRLNQMIELMNLQRIENDIYNDKDFKDSEGNLSGGEIQKINISRVLLKKSKFLIIDEITSAFDVKSAYELEKSLLDNKNLTLLNIQHKLNRELIDLYDEIIILEDGKVKNILKNSKEKELILNEL